MFSKIGLYLFNRRLRKRDYLVINEQPTSQILEVAKQLQEQGWELSREYDAVEQWPSVGSSTMRKGQSTLTFEWNEQSARVYGPNRIIKGIATERGISCVAQV